MSLSTYECTQLRRVLLHILLIRIFAYIQIPPLPNAMAFFHRCRCKKENRPTPLHLRTSYAACETKARDGEIAKPIDGHPAPPEKKNGVVSRRCTKAGHRGENTLNLIGDL